MKEGLTKKVNKYFLLGEKNIFLTLVITIFLTLLLFFLTGQEVKRERKSLMELAQSEGLNIAFSIQTLGPRFVLNENALKEILILLKKEGVNYIDICDEQGMIFLSTEEGRINRRINIPHQGKINIINTQERNGNRVLQVIKPFNLDSSRVLDVWKILPIRNSYLVVGIDLERYYDRLSEIRRRIILNYSIIMALVLLAIYIIYKLQETHIVKKTLSEMKDYTSKILETIDDAVISVDKQGIIKSFNRKSEEIFGKKKEEVIYKDCQKVLNLTSGGECIFKKCLREGVNINQEIVVEGEGLKKKFMEISTSFLADETGKTSGLVAVIRDVTEWKELNEEITRNKRLAALGRLSAGIAHEIRNPLSSIRGLAQFIAHTFSPEDERRVDLNTIIQEVDRLNNLVIQVLDYAKMKKLNLSYFSLTELIREIVELFQKQIDQKKIEFCLHFALSDTFLEADKDQIRQVLMNIIINAIQAISKEGKIKIETEELVYKGKPTIKLVVEDTGMGITEQNLPHIFDPFFSTKDQGSGLGLSIVFTLVESHQGEIKVESKEGRGTKFIIFLPKKGGNRFAKNFSN
ncbi:MAG: hypothetical protein Kow00103_08340 [Candidatus Caldatribacteriota bacterium]